MKAIGTALGCALTLSTLTMGYPTTTAQAQVQAEASLMAGGTFFLNDPPSMFEISSAREAEPKVVEGGEFGNAATVGVNAGLRFADRVTFEAHFMWASTELKAETGLEAEGGPKTWRF